MLSFSPFTTLALAAGLAASAAIGGGENATLVPGSEVAVAEGLVPLAINVSAHLVTTQGGKQLSQKALEGQMSLINRSFEPHNISFVLVETERIVDPLWGEGIDDLRMMWDNNRGDARTLNLYFVERFRDDAKLQSSSSAPDRIPTDRSAYRVDGAAVASYTVPGGPGWDAARWDGSAAVQAAAYWLGVPKSALGGCTGNGTQATTGDSACKTGFTPEQGRRMHQQWHAFRAPHRAPTGPPLSPVAHSEAKGKLPYYWDPTSLAAALVLCLPHEANATRETREDHCGTFIYCYFGTWKAAGTGEAYASNNTWAECENARAQPPSDEEAGATRGVKRPRASLVENELLSQLSR